MKKIISAILAIFMLLSFVACSTPSDTHNDNTNVNQSPDNSINNENNENASNEQNSSNTNNVLKSDTIVEVYGQYNEGLVFVKIKGDNENLYCIDKSGQVIFSIFASNATSFSNGLAYTSAGICDMNGNITTAQDLGGDKILEYDFAADYILVSRSTTSYTGTINELATFNTKFEKIVDFSSDFYAIYDEYNHLTFIDKYLPFYDFQDEYLDLYTGKIVNGKESLYSKVKIERQSDLWAREGAWGSVGGFYIYNRLDVYLSDERVPIIDLSQDPKYANIDKIGNFKNGIAPVTFKVADSEGEPVYYYTIMNEEGNFQFDPVQIGGSLNNFSFENGYFVCDVCVGGFWNSTKNRRLEVYDMTGEKVAQKDYSVSQIGDYTSIVISEGIIITKINDVYYLFDTELKPIF